MPSKISARTTAARSIKGELDGARIMCPRHGATFDVRSGEALTLPAIMPLPTYPVRIDGDDVYVTL